MRLGIVTSHPIQYQAPLFRALAELVDLHVYFAHAAAAVDQADAGFGIEFEWDSDLTGGYAHSFLRNVSKKPGIVAFDGCDTPDVGRTLAAARPDVVVVFGWHFKSYLQAARAARGLEIPVAVRCDSHLETPRPLVTRFVKSMIYPFFLAKFDTFLPTGSRATEYLRHYRVPQSRISLVPYCIDVETFRLGAEEAGSRRDQIRADWGVGPDECVVLFVGKLIEIKRVSDLLDAVGTLRGACCKVRVVLVGTGPLETVLRKQASDLQIAATFVGFANQSRLPGLYTAADILVLPSESETWGLVVNEAFACGLPAIVSDKVGCAPDLIREDLTGRVFPVGDISCLARAIEGFVGKKHDRSVAEALAEMTEGYTPQRSAAALVAAAEASALAVRKSMAAG